QIRWALHPSGGSMTVNARSNGLLRTMTLSNPAKRDEGRAHASFSENSSNCRYFVQRGVGSRPMTNGKYGPPKPEPGNNPRIDGHRARRAWALRVHEGRCELRHSQIPPSIS